MEKNLKPKAPHVIQAHSTQPAVIGGPSTPAATASSSAATSPCIGATSVNGSQPPTAPPPQSSHPVPTLTRQNDQSRSRIKTFRTQLFKRPSFKGFSGRRADQKSRGGPRYAPPFTRRIPNERNVPGSPRPSRQPPPGRPCPRLERYNMRLNQRPRPGPYPHTSGRSYAASPLAPQPQTSPTPPTFRVINEVRNMRQKKSRLTAGYYSPPRRAPGGGHRKPSDNPPGDDCEGRPPCRSPFGIELVERHEGSMFRRRDSSSDGDSSTDCEPYATSSRAPCPRRSRRPARQDPCENVCDRKGPPDDRLTRRAKSTGGIRETCVFAGSKPQILRLPTAEYMRRWVQNPNCESTETSSSFKSYLSDTDGYNTSVKEDLKRMKEEDHTWSIDSWMEEEIPSFPNPPAQPVSKVTPEDRSCKVEVEDMYCTEPKCTVIKAEKRADPRTCVPRKNLFQNHEEKAQHPVEDTDALDKRLVRYQRRERRLASEDNQRLHRSVPCEIDRVTGRSHSADKYEDLRKAVERRYASSLDLTTPYPRTVARRDTSPRGRVSDQDYDADSDSIRPENVVCRTRDKKQHAVLSEILEQLHQTHEVLDNFEQNLKAKSAETKGGILNDNDLRQLIASMQNESNNAGYKVSLSQTLKSLPCERNAAAKYKRHSLPAYIRSPKEVVVKPNSTAATSNSTMHGEFMDTSSARATRASTSKYSISTLKDDSMISELSDHRVASASSEIQNSDEHSRFSSSGGTVGSSINRAPSSESEISFHSVKKLKPVEVSHNASKSSMNKTRRTGSRASCSEEEGRTQKKCVRYQKTSGPELSASEEQFMRRRTSEIDARGARTSQHEQQPRENSRTSSNGRRGRASNHQTLPFSDDDLTTDSLEKTQSSKHTHEISKSSSTECKRRKSREQFKDHSCGTNGNSRTKSTRRSTAEDTCQKGRGSVKRTHSPECRSRETNAVSTKKSPDFASMRQSNEISDGTMQKSFLKQMSSTLEDDVFYDSIDCQASRPPLEKSKSSSKADNSRSRADNSRSKADNSRSRATLSKEKDETEKRRVQRTTNRSISREADAVETSAHTRNTHEASRVLTGVGARGSFKQMHSEREEESYCDSSDLRQQTKLSDDTRHTNPYLTYSNRGSHEGYPEMFRTLRESAQTEMEAILPADPSNCKGYKLTCRWEQSPQRGARGHFCSDSRHRGSVGREAHSVCVPQIVRAHQPHNSRQSCTAPPHVDHWRQRAIEPAPYAVRHWSPVERVCDRTSTRGRDFGLRTDPRNATFVRVQDPARALKRLERIERCKQACEDFSLGSSADDSSRQVSPGGTFVVHRDSRLQTSGRRQIPGSYDDDLPSICDYGHFTPNAHSSRIEDRVESGRIRRCSSSHVSSRRSPLAKHNVTTSRSQESYAQSQSSRPHTEVHHDTEIEKNIEEDRYDESIPNKVPARTPVSCPHLSVSHDCRTAAIREDPEALSVTYPTGHKRPAGTCDRSYCAETGAKVYHRDKVNSHGSVRHSLSSGAVICSKGENGKSRVHQRHDSTIYTNPTNESGAHPTSSSIHARERQAGNESQNCYHRTSLSIERPIYDTHLTQPNRCDNSYYTHDDCAPCSSCERRMSWIAPQEPGSAEGTFVCAGSRCSPEQEKSLHNGNHYKTWPNFARTPRTYHGTRSRIEYEEPTHYADQRQTFQNFEVCAHAHEPEPEPEYNCPTHNFDQEHTCPKYNSTHSSAHECTQPRTKAERQTHDVALQRTCRSFIAAPSRAHDDTQPWSEYGSSTPCVHDDTQPWPEYETPDNSVHIQRGARNFVAATYPTLDDTQPWPEYKTPEKVHTYQTTRNVPRGHDDTQPWSEYDSRTPTVDCQPWPEYEEPIGCVCPSSSSPQPCIDYDDNTHVCPSCDAAASTEDHQCCPPPRHKESRQRDKSSRRPDSRCQELPDDAFVPMQPHDLPGRSLFASKPHSDPREAPAKDSHLDATPVDSRRCRASCGSSRHCARYLQDYTTKDDRSYFQATEDGSLVDRDGFILPEPVPPQRELVHRGRSPDLDPLIHPIPHDMPTPGGYVPRPRPIPREDRGVDAAGYLKPRELFDEKASHHSNKTGRGQNLITVVVDLHAPPAGLDDSAHYVGHQVIRPDKEDESGICRPLPDTNESIPAGPTTNSVAADDRGLSAIFGESVPQVFIKEEWNSTSSSAERSSPEACKMMSTIELSSSESQDGHHDNVETVTVANLSPKSEPTVDELTVEQVQANKCRDSSSPSNKVAVIEAMDGGPQCPVDQNDPFARSSPSNKVAVIKAMDGGPQPPVDPSNPFARRRAIPKRSTDTANGTCSTYDEEKERTEQDTHAPNNDRTGERERGGAKEESFSRKCLADRIRNSSCRQLLEDLNNDPHFRALIYHLIGPIVTTRPLSELTTKDKERLIVVLKREMRLGGSGWGTPLRQLEDDQSQNDEGPSGC